MAASSAEASTPYFERRREDHVPLPLPAVGRAAMVRKGLSFVWHARWACGKADPGNQCSAGESRMLHTVVPAADFNSHPAASPTHRCTSTSERHALGGAARTRCCTHLHTSPQPPGAAPPAPAPSAPPCSPGGRDLRGTSQGMRERCWGRGTEAAPRLQCAPEPPAGLGRPPCRPCHPALACLSSSQASQAEV